MSSFRADDTGDFAHVRTGLAARLLRAAEVLPRGTHLLLIEGYRPPALQRRYFEDYLSSLREASPGSDEEQLRMLTSRYVSPPEIAPHSADAAIDLTLRSGDGSSGSSAACGSFDEPKRFRGSWTSMNALSRNSGSCSVTGYLTLPAGTASFMSCAHNWPWCVIPAHEVSLASSDDCAIVASQLGMRASGGTLRFGSSIHSWACLSASL